MKIFACCNWQLKFLGPMLDYWRRQGHEVRYELGYNPAGHEWSDVCFVDVCDHNAHVASEYKFPNSRLVIRAIDIECWVQQSTGVHWENVDVCIFMAKHIEELVRSYMTFPANVQVVHIPPGIDLSKWTYRERDGSNHSVAFIAHQWSAKGMPLLFQVMAALGSGWVLHILGNQSNERWLHKYNEHIVRELGLQVVFTERVPSVDAWLDDKDYIIIPGQKEAFSYVTAEAAAKGIKPLVHNFWRARDIWPDEWVWSTIGEAVAMAQQPFDSASYRRYIADHYTLDTMMERINSVCGITQEVT